jgi:ankyrin repeat protein
MSTLETMQGIFFISTVLTLLRNTALHMAAWQEKHNSAEIIETLLRNGASARECNIQDNTPLHHACQAGHAFVVMLLLDHHASPSTVNVDLDTPLDIAARTGHRDVVALLLTHDPTLCSDTRALREASRTGRKEIVRLLLDAGVDCTAPDPLTGDTALHEACRFVRVEVAEHLLAFGADAHVANGAGETALVMAEGYPEGPKRSAMMKLMDGSSVFSCSKVLC